VGTVGRRERDGGGFFAPPPIDFLFGREVVRDIREADYVLVFTVGP
jgi:hypothetical protein